MKRITMILLTAIVTIALTSESFAGENTFCSCFRGQPRPRCCSFVILETGVMYNVTRSGAREGKAPGIFTFDLGMMFNTHGNSAWGGSFHLAADDDAARIGFGPRYHKWLTNSLALEVSPRFLFGNEENYGVETKFPGFALTTSLSMSDIVSFDTYLQMVSYERYQSVLTSPSTYTIEKVEKTEVGLYFGVTGRTALAPAWPVVILIAAIISDDGFYD